MSFGPGGWIHGSTISKERTVRFLSVSQMQQADDCTRKWWYEKVGGRKPPEQIWQTDGKVLHAEVENYLKTGEKRLSSLAMSGWHMLPEPGDDLLIERDLIVPLDYSGPEPTAKTSQWFLDRAPLRAAGIPVLGQLDLAHGRGINKGGSDVEATIDPPGTVEVLDWKTTSDFKWAKTGPELIESIQMAGYGVWILNQRPEVSHIRLSHGYFRTKGAAASRKVTILASAEQIRRSWEHAEGVARLISDAAKATSAEDVQYNLSACDKFRGCCHRSYCTAGMDMGVSTILGLTQSDALKPKTAGLIPMGSLLTKVKKDVSAPSPSPSSPAAPDASAIALERQKLEAAEKAAKLRRLVPEGFEAQCSAIRGLNVGFPTLKGKAAIAYAASGGQEVAPDFEFPGSGTYSYVEIEDPAMMKELFDQLTEELSNNPSASPLPPDAPASDPKLAFAAEAEEKIAQMPTSEDPMKKKEPPPPPEPKKRGPRKPEQKQTGSGECTEPDGKIDIYIDCRPSTPHLDLYNWVNEIADRLAGQYPGTDKDGNKVQTLDIRCAPIDSALAYDKWVGALTAMIRSADHTPLEPGDYYIDTRGSKLREISADALKERAEKSGGKYVRSSR